MATSSDAEPIMNIFYLHGLARGFDPDSSALKSLSTLGHLQGRDINYYQPANQVVDQCIKEIISTDTDLLVGESIGGWLASVTGSRAGIPFVAANPILNPAVIPLERLDSRWEREFARKPAPTAWATYGSFALDGCGLILLDRSDELVDWRETQSFCNGAYSIATFAGGSHAFAHWEEALSLIRDHFDQASLVYGL